MQLQQQHLLPSSAMQLRRQHLLTLLLAASREAACRSPVQSLASLPRCGFAASTMVAVDTAPQQLVATSPSPPYIPPSPLPPLSSHPLSTPILHPHRHRRRRCGGVATGPRRARSFRAGPDGPGRTEPEFLLLFATSPQRHRQAASRPGPDGGLSVCAVPHRAVRGGAQPARQAARARAAPRN
jgi:hypothetical protein